MYKIITAELIILGVLLFPVFSNRAEADIIPAQGRLPKSLERPSIEVMAEITKYTADVAETDSEPLIMANGGIVHDGAIACPGKYRFGTVIEINDKFYKCSDRMALKYRTGNYFDVFTWDKKEARKWGRRKIIIKIYGNMEK